MAQQTSVEWLENELENNHIVSYRSDDYVLFKKLLKKAKGIHKSEMHQCASFWRGKENDIEKQFFEQYYNETFNK